jgi:hypothetical protein
MSDKYICTICRNEVSRDAKTCPPCGSPIGAIICESCGIVVDHETYRLHGCPKCARKRKTWRRIIWVSCIALIPAGFIVNEMDTQKRISKEAAVEVESKRDLEAGKAVAVTFLDLLRDGKIAEAYHSADISLHDKLNQAAFETCVKTLPIQAACAMSRGVGVGDWFEYTQDGCKYSAKCRAKMTGHSSAERMGFTMDMEDKYGKNTSLTTTMRKRDGVWRVDGIGKYEYQTPHELMTKQE